MARSVETMETAGGLPWDPIWQYVLGDDNENDSFYTGTDGGASFEASTIASHDEEETMITDDAGSFDDGSEDDPRMDSRSGRNYVSKERYEETLKALTLFQQLAEERRLRNEALTKQASRRIRLLQKLVQSPTADTQPQPPVPPPPSTLSRVASIRAAYSMGRKNSTVSNTKGETKVLSSPESTVSTASVKYWPAFRKSPTNIETSERSAKDDAEPPIQEAAPQTKWEWELDPEIFPPRDSQRDATEKSKSSNASYDKMKQNSTKLNTKAKKMLNKLICRTDPAVLLERGQRVSSNKSRTTSCSDSSGKR